VVAKDNGIADWCFSHPFGNKGIMIGATLEVTNKLGIGLGSNNDKYPRKDQSLAPFKIIRQDVNQFSFL
jgi:hypothetical protein